MGENGWTGVVYFLGFGLLFYWMMRRGGCGMHAHGRGGHGGHGANGGHGGHGDPSEHDETYRAARGRGVVVDPVCGMKIDSDRAAGTRMWAGNTFSFCSADCLARFDAAPERYASNATGPHGT